MSIPDQYLDLARRHQWKKLRAIIPGAENSNKVAKWGQNRVIWDQGIEFRLIGKCSGDCLLENIAQDMVLVRVA